MPAATILFITDNQNLRRLPKTHGISNKQFRNYFILLAPRHQLIGILGLRRDDGHLFPADGDLGQQPGIGLRKTLQVIGVVHRQRTPDKALLVDCLLYTSDAADEL